MSKALAAGEHSSGIWWLDNAPQPGPRLQILFPQLMACCLILVRVLAPVCPVYRSLTGLPAKRQMIQVIPFYITSVGVGIGMLRNYIFVIFKHWTTCPLTHNMAWAKWKYIPICWSEFNYFVAIYECLRGTYHRMKMSVWTSPPFAVAQLISYIAGYRSTSRHSPLRRHPRWTRSPLRQHLRGSPSIQHSPRRREYHSGSSLSQIRTGKMNQLNIIISFFAWLPERRCHSVPLKLTLDDRKWPVSCLLTRNTTLMVMDSSNYCRFERKELLQEFENESVIRVPHIDFKGKSRSWHWPC